MSGYGYEQTLDAPRCEVCFLLGSGRADREFREPKVLGSLSTPKQTSETRSLDVCS